MATVGPPQEGQASDRLPPGRVRRTLDRPLTGAAVNVHPLRTSAVTNALDHPADVAQVQAWCGHSSIATTKPYDRRHSRPEDSPTFKVAY